MVIMILAVVIVGVALIGTGVAVVIALIKNKKE